MPRILYHYTSAAGLLGIVNQQRLRATNFSYLNDSSEITYGLDLIRQRLALRIGRDETTRKMLSEARDVLDDFAPLSETYVACFSTRRDDLSQWRGYGDNIADRYCLAFKRPQLQLVPDIPAASPPPMFLPYLASVIYSSRTQSERVDMMIDTMLARPPEVTSHSSHMTPIRFSHAMHIAMALLNVAPRFKSETFKAESEWRRVLTGVDRIGTPVYFCVRDGRLRPYLNLCLKTRERRLPIEEMMLLPHGAAASALKATQMLLTTRGYPAEIVTLSTIPFIG